MGGINNPVAQWGPANYGSGLPPELLARINANAGAPLVLGDVSGSAPAQFVVQPGQSHSVDYGENSSGMVTDPSEIQYHPQGQGAGENFYRYDANTGNYLGSQKGSGIMSGWQGLLAVAGAGAGFGALGAAAGGAGAAAGTGAGATGGAGVTGFGDAGTMYAGGNAADAATLGGGGSMYGGAGAAGTAGMGGGAAAFNPAMDSQLASTQLGITGDQAAADAAATATPSVTVNGASSGNWLSNMMPTGGVSNPYTSGGPSLTDALRTASKVYGQMGQQRTQQAQMPLMGMQDNRPSSFVGQAPGYAPIASPPKRSPMLGGLNNPWSPYMVGLMGSTNG